MSDMNKNELKYIPIDTITPSDFNPQTQSDNVFNMLVDDILDNGVISAITVIPNSDGGYTILGGEHRWRAAKVAGETEIPALVLMDDKFTTEDARKFITVRLNALQGKLDPQKFLSLYTELAQKHGKEAVRRLMGFANDKALHKIINQVKDNAKKLLPKEMHEDLEKAAGEVKAVEDLNLIVQSMFQQHGKTLNQGYIVFSHGTQEHIYINMSKKVKKSMDKLLSYCRTTGKNINEVLSPILEKEVDLVISNYAPSVPVMDSTTGAEF